MSILDSLTEIPSITRMTVKLKDGEDAGVHKFNGFFEAPEGERWEKDSELRERRIKTIKDNL